MHNPFAKPHTLGQWLLGSVCWTVSCVGGWILLLNILVLQPRSFAIDMVGVSAFWLAHALIWWRAIAGGIAFLRSPVTEVSGLELAGRTWRVLLYMFQIAGLLLGAIGTHVTLLLGGAEFN
jgi:hypothetical protein